MPFELCEEFDKLNLRIVANAEVMEMEVGSSLLQEIQKGQLEDEKIQVKSLTSSTLGLLLMQKSWKWKLVQVYFKRFRKVNWKTRRSKR
jgi:hypothetical protein